MIIEEKYLCGYQYVDANLKMKNSAILCLLEDMAGLHGIYAGESLLTSTTAWILTAYKIIVKKRPIYGDRITMRTWSKGIKNFTAYREFEMLDADGEQIVCAFSEWAHINRADGTLAKAEPELIESYCSEPDRTNFEAPRIRRQKEPTEFVAQTQHTISRLMIDTNHHVNNVYYLDLASDAVEQIAGEDYTADSFEIFYKKEIKCGQTVSCRATETEEGYQVLIVGEDDTTHAQIILYK